jgi:hypothetical protein
VARLVPTSEGGAAVRTEHAADAGRSQESIFLYVAVAALGGGAILALIVGGLWLRGSRTPGEQDATEGPPES